MNPYLEDLDLSTYILRLDDIELYFNLLFKLFVTLSNIT